ncbi:MAG: hypothetical protein ABR507_08310 [Actinomycetota bacterium]|nr:hypothetical protein [Actinomycetota bacterium]
MTQRRRSILMAVGLALIAAAFVWLIRDTMSAPLLALTAVILSAPAVVKFDRALSEADPAKQPTTLAAGSSSDLSDDDPTDEPAPTTGQRGRSARKPGSNA